MAVGYYRVDGVQLPLSKLYRNTGSGFEDVISTEHLLNAGDHGVEWIDYDNDGDIDLSLTDGYGAEGGHFLFRNDLEPSLSSSSLAVLVLGKNKAFTKSGSEVRVYDSNNDIIASRIVSTGGGYNTQSATPVYFGLPSNEAVSVEVRFMGANGGTVQRIEGGVLEDRAHLLVVMEQ